MPSRLDVTLLVVLVVIAVAGMHGTPTIAQDAPQAPVVVAPAKVAPPTPQRTQGPGTPVAAKTPTTSGPTITTRTVKGQFGDTITYRPAPNRKPDLEFRMTCYQPCAKTNRPWLDSCTGGGACDVHGQTLRWGVLAANQRKWRYGTRVYLGAPFWQVFEVRDDFARPQPRDRADLCCWEPDSYRYWRAVAESGEHSMIHAQAWVLRDGE